MVQHLDKRLFTLKESAHYLGRGIDAMRELVYRREIPVIQQSGRSKIWLDVMDLNVWIEENKQNRQANNL